MQKQTKVLLAIIAAVAILGVAVLYSGGGLQGKIMYGTESKGKLQITVATTTPNEDIVVAGSVNKLVSIFKATASGDEGFEIKKLTVVNRYDKVKGDTDNNIKTVRLRYTDSAGTTVSKNVVLVNGVAAFSGLHIIVPKNNNANINVSADFNTISAGATSGEMVALSIGAFEASGLQSGSKISSHVKNGLKIVNWMHVYGSKPTLVLNANSPSGSHAVSTNDKVFVFDVIADPADGLAVERVLINMMSDADFDFDINNPPIAVLQDESGNVIANPAEVKFVSTSKANVELITQFELSKGEKRTLSLVLDTAKLLSEEAWADDPLTFAIGYGYSIKGKITPGDFAWEDSTLTNAEWLGVQSNSYLYSNTLIY